MIDVRYKPQDNREKLSERIGFRITESEMIMIKERAEQHGMSYQAYARYVLFQALAGEEGSN